jgi:excinuclease ABC subunit A
MKGLVAQAFQPVQLPLSEQILNTIIVIEPNLEGTKTTGHLIHLGPEGGDGGGKLVATGPPEEVAQHPESHTRRFLRQILQ